MSYLCFTEDVLLMHENSGHVSTCCAKVERPTRGIPTVTRLAALLFQENLMGRSHSEDKKYMQP